MELQLLRQVVPVVEFNNEELKSTLTVHLEKYNNLVVTEETEKDCKKAKAELAKLEKSIDSFRIDTKRLLSEPITTFELQCKELTGLIQTVKAPIDEQLKLIDEKRKEEKSQLINDEIAKIVCEYELDEKHSAQIAIQATWLNKTTSMSKITTDIKNLAEVLKNAQMSVVRHKQIIENTCEMYNNRLNNKLDPFGFVVQLEKGIDVNDIATTIHNEGNRRLQEEMTQIDQEIKQAINEPVAEPTVHKAPIESIYTPNPNDEIFGLNIRIYGTEEQFSAFKNIMASIGMKFEKLN